VDIQGKVVIITGASAGIGLCTAKLFAQHGAKLALAARSADKLGQLVDELTAQGHTAIAIPTDVRQQAEVERLIDQTFSHYGQIDVLINNAGQAAAGHVSNVSLEDFRQIIDLNIFGPIYAIQAVVPKMKQNGGGLILNISSNVTKLAIPGIGAYASTKSALNKLSETARGELAPENIRVITVYPRLTATDFGKNARRTQQVQNINPTANMTPDTPEYVAEKILEAAQNEPAEQFMA
jgi:NADP-dependent 3-hydroxy acid dehydrogenase YdfG